MFAPYKKIFAYPGAFAFSLAGLVARFPMSIIGLSMILMISTVYGNYSMAGQVSAVTMIAFAVCAPTISRLVDRYGQRHIMLPAITISAACLIGIVIVGALQANPIWLYALGIVGGATSGSMGALVRSRWSNLLRRPGELHTAFALESVLDEVVYMFGPVLATSLATMVHPVAGLVAAAVLLLCGGYWFLSLRNTEPAPNAVDTAIKEPSIMLSGPMVSLALVYVAMGAMFGAMDIVVVAFSTAQGNRGASGVLLAVLALGSFFSGIIYGSRTWSVPLWKLYLIGIATLALGVFPYPFANSIPMLGALMLITGIAVSPTMTNVTAIVQRIVPARRLTEGLTWMSTSITVGVAVGAWVGGYLVDYAGIHSGFILVTALGWFMVLVAFATISPLRRAQRSPHLPKESIRED